MSTLKVDGIRSNSATSDAITLASNGTCTANITNNLSNRNLIINGAMQVAQRGTSFADSRTYNLDRFFLQNNSGTPAYTVTQDSDAPHGFDKSLKVACTTADASPAAGSISRLYQYIEAQNMQGLAKGTSSAKACTLSFYVKTNKTGLYTVFVYDANNTRLMSNSYTVSNTDWNRYTILIPADTTGVLNDGAGQGFGIFFGLSLGSDRTSGSIQSNFGSYAAGNEHPNNVNFADNTSNVWAITGIQLEVDQTGSGVATDFEHRSFGQELAKCQRYYYRISADASGQGFGMGYQMTSSAAKILINLPVTMRTKATAVETSGTASDYSVARTSTYEVCNAVPTFANATIYAVQVNTNQTQASLNTGQSVLLRSHTTDFFLGFSAELT